MNRAMIIIAVFVMTAALLASLQGPAAASPQGSAKHFPAPEEAAAALVDACGDNEVKSLYEILGPGAQPLLETSDRALDQQLRKDFVRSAREHRSLEKAGAGRMILVVGTRKWPFPIPLVKSAQGWYFDTAAGIEEILNRRIGRNELNAIAVCRFYVDAQRQYASRDRSGTSILEYARRFESTPGKKDGLYWPAKDGEEMSPIGPLFTGASEYRDSRKQGEPYYGYYFKILERQGPGVPGGAFNYVINGHMLAGFALVAWPADYGTSGVMTFVVNQWGHVYQKDLGRDTSRLARSMTGYNPDTTWKRVKEKGHLASE